jgi:hypothetical protein
LAIRPRRPRVTGPELPEVFKEELQKAPNAANKKVSIINLFSVLPRYFLIWINAAMCGHLLKLARADKLFNC